MMNQISRPRRHLRRWLAALGALLVAMITVTALSLWPPRYSGPGPIFVGDFESGEIAEDEWQRDSKGDCSIRPVTAPVRAGNYAAEFVTTAGGRCELLPWIGSTILGRQIREPFNMDRWYAFSVYLPADREPDKQNEVIAQWHSSRDVFFGEKGGRGPPLALRIEGEHWKITYGWDAALVSRGKYKAGHTLWAEPYTTGRWTDWVFHVRWSHRSDGLTEVWRDGKLIARREGPNAYNDLRGVYLKLGIYHPGRERTLYLDEVRIGGEGADYACVAPPAPP